MANLRTVIGCVVIFLSVVAASSAGTHTVHWSLGNDYTSFTSANTFLVGDTLSFNYGAGHTVDEVTKSDYESCTVGNSISSDSNGPTSIALKTPGTHYFICSVPGHCSGGMKLAVTVAASGAGTGGGGSTATPTPSSGGGSGSTKGSSASAAVSLSPAVLFLALVAALYVFVMS